MQLMCNLSCLAFLKKFDYFFQDVYFAKTRTVYTNPNAIFSVYFSNFVSFYNCINKGIHKGLQMWRKMLTQNLGSQNLPAFIRNLAFNFVSLKIARGRKILRAFVNPLNMSILFYLQIKAYEVLKDLRPVMHKILFIDFC